MRFRENFNIQLHGHWGVTGEIRESRFTRELVVR
jgi:hypothetical protein